MLAALWFAGVSLHLLLGLHLATLTTAAAVGHLAWLAVGLITLGWAARQEPPALSGQAPRQSIEADTEEPFRAMAECGAGWEIWIDPAGRARWTNAMVEEFTGLAPGESLRHPDFPVALVHPDDRDRVRRALLDPSSPERGRGLEFRIMTRDGAERWMLAAWNPLHAQNGAALGRRISLQDITALKAVPTVTAECERQLRALLDDAPDAICIQRGLRFIYANAAAARLLGAENAADLQGRRALDFLAPEFRAAVRQRIRELQAAPATDRMEVTCLTLTGGRVDVETTAVPFGQAGRPATVLFMHDVSERKRLESQLRQAQKLEAVGQLAAGVAHDFNNVLSAILLHLGLIRQLLDLDPEFSAQIEELERDARRAAGITRQLLVFSRREGTRLQPLDLATALQSVLRLLRRLLGEHIEILTEGFDTPLPAIEADAGHIDQVVINLAVNARDAMPNGGRLTLALDTVAIDEAAAARHAEARPGHFVRLRVSDTGTGMDETTLTHLFEPFFTTKAAGQGTGLGLATVLGIVRRHGGWIEVESALGCGSTFSLFLPALSAAAGAAPAPAPRTAAKGGSERVLLVEDDPVVRGAIRAGLVRLGYSVIEAGNADEALQRWAEDRDDIALLVTDVVMPGSLNGVDLAERLHTERPDLPVLALSGYQSALDRSRLAQAPWIDLLSKPVDLSTLADATRRALDRRSTARP